MNQRMFERINEVEKFMMECRARDDAKGDHGIPYDSMAYGEALHHWHAKGRPSNSYFSTEDPSVLELAAELCKEFGLEVVTREEGLAREAAVNAKRKNVSGFDWMN
jgi:hypothetical protein